MWEDLLKFGEGAWESISEGAIEAVDVFVDSRVNQQREKARDPETLQTLAPEKATRTDGSTIVDGAQGRVFIQGVDNNIVIGAGVLLTVGLLWYMKGAK